MPRYYLDLYNDICAIDNEGVVLRDVAAAQKHTEHEALEMIRASVEEGGHIDLSHHIDVRDESDAVVCVVHFADVVRITRGDVVLNQGAVRP